MPYGSLAVKIEATLPWGWRSLDVLPDALTARQEKRRAAQNIIDIAGDGITHAVALSIHRTKLGERGTGKLESGDAAIDECEPLALSIRRLPEFTHDLTTIVDASRIG